jgi:hypothetical protein
MCTCLCASQRGCVFEAPPLDAHASELQATAQELHNRITLSGGPSEANSCGTCLQPPVQHALSLLPFLNPLATSMASGICSPTIGPSPCLVADFVSPVLYCAARIAGGWKLRAGFQLDGSLGSGPADYAFILDNHDVEHTIPVKLVSGVLLQNVRHQPCMLLPRYSLHKQAAQCVTACLYGLSMQAKSVKRWQREHYCSTVTPVSNWFIKKSPHHLCPLFCISRFNRRMRIPSHMRWCSEIVP